MRVHWPITLLLFSALSSWSQTRFNEGICNGSDAYSQTWEYVGHTNDIEAAGAMGRVNMVYVDEKNDPSLNTVFAGTDFSGLWKTTNFQSESPNWQCLTCDSRLPGIGMVSMDMHPENPREMLLSTGIGANFSLNYGLGVVRSDDGGKTWNTTSLSFDKRGTMIPAFRAKYKPDEPNVVVALSRNEIYRSEDGGKNFKRVYTIPKKNKGYRRPFLNDLYFHPSKSQYVYASSENGETAALRDGGGRFLMSTDGGKTWLDRTELLPGAVDENGHTKYDRVELAINPKNSNSLTVYGIGSAKKKELFTTQDITATSPKWSKYTLSRNAGSWWMADLEYSVNDTSVLYLGHEYPYIVKPSKAKKGKIGINRIQFNLHIDIRDIHIARLPDGSEQFFVAHDGGIGVGIKAANGKMKWLNKNGSGLHITQFFGIDVSSEYGFVGGGTQDLGFIYSSGNKWARHHIGDGYDCEFDHKHGTFFVGNNTSLLGYRMGEKSKVERASKPFTIGRMQRAAISESGMIFYAPYASGNGGWGGDQTQRDEIDEDGDGNTREYIKGNFVMFYRPWDKQPKARFVKNRPPEIDKGGQRMSAISLVNNDTNFLYVATDKRRGNKVCRLYKIENPSSDNAKWIDLSASLTKPAGRCPKDLSQGITDILINPKNPKAIWLAFQQNISKGKTKILYHPNVSDTSLEWIAIEKGLDQFPINKLKIDEETGIVYAATDIGVYLNKNPTDPNSAWECFNRSLPVVKVNDLEIDPCSQQLFASTFGRGIWATDLVKDESVPLVTTLSSDTVIEAPAKYYSNLLITGKSTVVVKGDLKLGNGCTIDIDRGCELIIEGTLSNTCDSSEIPIEVLKGNFLNGLFSKPGKVEVKGP